MSFEARPRRRHERATGGSDSRRLISGMTYEVVPLKNLTGQVDDLPAHSRVSVTCSPNKTIEESLDVVELLAGIGYQAIPHIASRMVADRSHLRRIAHRINDLDVHEVFVIGGDTADPGDYPDTMSLLPELLDMTDNQLTHVGVGSYPDGHAIISDNTLHEALHRKQEFFAEAGIRGHATTQMCFSPDTITKWITRERSAGFALPIHLGVPGVVDRAKLLTMGMQLGVGASLSYLKKNRSGVVKLLASSSFSPSRLIDPLSGQAVALGIDGLHVFTFNQIVATAKWQRSITD